MHFIVDSTLAIEKVIQQRYHRGINNIEKFLLENRYTSALALSALYGIITFVPGNAGKFPLRLITLALNYGLFVGLRYLNQRFVETTYHPTPTLAGLEPSAIEQRHVFLRSFRGLCGTVCAYFAVMVLIATIHLFLPISQLTSWLRFDFFAAGYVLVYLALYLAIIYGVWMWEFAAKHHLSTEIKKYPLIAGVAGLLFVYMTLTIQAASPW